MKQFITNKPVAFGVGYRLKLSEDQVKDRAFALADAGKKNVYTTLQTVHFKAGEEIGLDLKKGETLPRILQGALDDPEDNGADQETNPENDNSENNGLADESLLNLNGGNDVSGNS